ncbi:Uracil permease [Sporosarcina sp. ACRSM]|uniref:CsxC family protein n=1 Tax=Sporosarcina sp. ACRSM TaxID=2918216 RepID=UPI001EF5AD01|nr:Uracil permease [Sporosarcina sp. ACRSM]MCG7335718.1 Uracil permease [Sporosarcina sp. ACRSM]
MGNYGHTPHGTPDGIPPCEVNSLQQIPLTDDAIGLQETVGTPTFKVPVVLAERTLQIVVESDISLEPSATEIKRVTKNVFLDQVKLVPVRFCPIGDTDFFEVTRAKLFVSGHIRKDIEYATRNCHGGLRDRIAEVPFSGFAEITADEFLEFPVIGISDSSTARFLNDKNEIEPRLDKYFFQNLVKYNEQPYGELLGANFYELDFSPVHTKHGGEFSTLREKTVLDLHLKVLQVQQWQVAATRTLPIFDEGTLDI